jgi:multidrug resistance efflux pump
MYSMQASMFTDWDTFMQIAQNSTYQNEDGTPNHVNRSLPEFHIANDNWLASEAKYKNQQNVVTQAQTALSAAWSSYQQTSPVIYAPISGTVTGFSLQEGSVIVASTNTSNSAQSATKIASIKTNKSLPMVSVNLTEIDVPKVSIGDKATITLSVFGQDVYRKSISIDTAGTTSSASRLSDRHQAGYGIGRDTAHMAASANIITIRSMMFSSYPFSIKTQDGGYYVLS